MSNPKINLVLEGLHSRKVQEAKSPSKEIDQLKKLLDDVKKAFNKAKSLAKSLTSEEGQLYKAFKDAVMQADEDELVKLLKHGKDFTKRVNAFNADFDKAVNSFKSYKSKIPRGVYDANEDEIFDLEEKVYDYSSELFDIGPNQNGFYYLKDASTVKWIMDRVISMTAAQRKKFFYQEYEEDRD